LYIIVYVHEINTCTKIYKLFANTHFVYYNTQMIDLDELARQIALQRKKLGITQDELAIKARVSRPLIAKLETGRYPEIGIRKLLRILNAMGLDLRLTTMNLKRPTLEDLAAEEEEGKST
jgi:HTH-type transcriptional regulator/antitoxin HipB